MTNFIHVICLSLSKRLSLQADKLNQTLTLHIQTQAIHLSIDLLNCGIQLIVLFPLTLLCYGLNFARLFDQGRKKVFLCTVQLPETLKVSHKISGPENST